MSSPRKPSLLLGLTVLAGIGIIVAMVHFKNQKPPLVLRNYAADAAERTPEIAADDAYDKLGQAAGALYGVSCDHAKRDGVIVDQGGGALAFRIRCYNPEDVGSANGAIFRVIGQPGGGMPKIELVSR